MPNSNSYFQIPFVSKGSHLFVLLQAPQKKKNFVFLGIREDPPKKSEISVKVQRGDLNIHSHEENEYACKANLLDGPIKVIYYKIYQNFKIIYI